MAAPVRAIGFDYTGVVAQLPDGNIFDQVAEIAGVQSEAVRASYHNYNRKFQLGKLSQEQLWTMLAADLHIQDRFPELWNAARSRLPRIDLDLLAFVDQLRSVGYKTGLLSNLAPHTPWHEQFYREGVPAHFDAVCLSGETGLAKPDPAAFEDLARKLGSVTHELVYIDDRPQAFAALEHLGIRTITCSHLRQLKTDLRFMGCTWPTIHQK